MRGDVAFGLLRGGSVGAVGGEDERGGRARGERAGGVVDQGVVLEEFDDAAEGEREEAEEGVDEVLVGFDAEDLFGGFGEEEGDGQGRGPFAGWHAAVHAQLRCARWIWLRHLVDDQLILGIASIRTAHGWKPCVER